MARVLSTHCSYTDRLSEQMPGPNKLIRLFLTGGFRGSGEGAEQIPVHTPGRSSAGSPDVTAASVTWIGHASFLLRIGGLAVLVDPVLSPRIVGAGARITPPGMDWTSLPTIDAVLISHNHYDHLDAPTLRRLPRDTPMVVPAGLGRWFRGRRFTTVHELDWWESIMLGEVELAFVPAHHWSRRGPFDYCRSLWGGWVLTSGDGTRLYHAGDTGYGFRLAEIGSRYPGIDVAMLPIGAYEPRWFLRPMHMNPEEAVAAMADLGARRMVGMHWGTFKLSREPVLEPPRRMRLAWAATGREAADLWNLAVGETRALDVRDQRPVQL